MTAQNIYYVYAYLREDGTPYYIGKGHNNRAFSKRHSVFVPRKDSNKIVILEKNLTEVGALALERRLIRWWGRKEDGGILRNKTLGGDGKTGYGVSRPHSQETKEKISKAKQGKSYPKLTEANRKTGKKRCGTKLSKETRQKISETQKGRIMTEEHRANLSKAGIGRPVSEETRQKMREKNSKKSTCPHCGLTGGGSAMVRWHFDNCKSK